MNVSPRPPACRYTHRNKLESLFVKVSAVIYVVHCESSGAAAVAITAFAPATAAHTKVTSNILFKPNMYRKKTKPMERVMMKKMRWHTFHSLDI